jgi:hypothetical protein
MQVDGYSLPDGYVVSAKASMGLHNRIQNDSVLRERIEAADRMTGTESIHLAMLRHDHKKPSKQTEAALLKNQQFGEKIMKKRIHDEGKALEGSVAANEKLAA